VGERQASGYFSLTVLVDKYIGRPDIAHLAVTAMESVGSLQNGEGQVPQLCILELLPLGAVAVGYLTLQQKGVVIEVDLGYV